MNVGDIIHRNYTDRGFSQIDYRVVLPDMRVVCTTRDFEKASRIAEQCNGTIHSSKEIIDETDI